MWGKGAESEQNNYWEKYETVILVTCCSAEGQLHPPALICKGENLKSDFQDGLSLECKVYMDQKAANINQ